MGSKYIAFYENIGTGIQFNNIRYSPVEGDRFTCFETVLFMLFDTLIYLLLMWYIENVFPGIFQANKFPLCLLLVVGSYGIPKKWYFPFTASYWTGESHQPINWSEKFKENRFIKWITCRKRRMRYDFNWSTTNLDDSGRNQSMKFIWINDERDLLCRLF